MSKSPISDLYKKPVPAQPAPAPSSPRTNDGAGGGVLLLALIVALTLGYVLYDRYKHSPSPRPDDQQEQKDDASPVSTEGYLMLIYERKNPTLEEVAMVDVVRELCQQSKGLEYRTPDKDDPNDKVQEIIAFGKSKGIDPPMVVYKDKQTNKLRNAIKWPTNKGELLKVLK